MTLASSTVTGDLGLLGVGPDNTISVTGGSRIDGNLVHRGPSLAGIDFDASSIVGNIHAEANNTRCRYAEGQCFYRPVLDR